MSSLSGWFRRYVSLVEYVELWGSTAAHPANDALRSHGVTPDDPEYYIVRPLVQNVIHAAGAVEYTVGKITAALADEQAWFLEHVTDPNEGMGVVGPNRDALQYEFANLLFWLKAVQERIKPVNSPGGLLPMLSQGESWTIHIRQAYQVLRQQTLSESALVNYTTHRGAVTQAFGAARVRDGKLIVPVPDVPDGRVELWDDFTYDDQRDLGSFASTALAAVEAFMDAMLAALEDARVEIERKRERDIKTCVRDRSAPCPRALPPGD